MAKAKHIFCLLTLIVSGCLYHSDFEAPSRHCVDTPTNIVAKSDSIIISRIGLSIFAQCFKYDPTRLDATQSLIRAASDGVHQKWHMELDAPIGFYSTVYRFTTPGKPWINEPINLLFDSHSNLIAIQPEGVFDNLSHPDSCTFSIPPDSAIAIAKQDGLERGIKSWQLSFGWGGPEFREFTWAVSNTIDLMHGNVRILDPNNGKVLARSVWMVMQ